MIAQEWQRCMWLIQEPKLSAFEQEVTDLKIRHFKITKGMPELNGKVKRFNRTIKQAMQNQE